MEGGGSIQGNDNSLNNNHKLLQKGSLFNKKRSLLELRREYQSAINGIADYNMASEDDLKRIRAKIIKQRRIDNVITICIFLLIIPFVIAFSSSYFKTDETEGPTYAEKKSMRQDSTKYSFFSTDGDNYLKNGQWHNAIFQYKKALEIYPSNYDAQYRLAYAYTYRCRNTKVNCELANRFVQKLRSTLPERQELIELEQVLIFTE